MGAYKMNTTDLKKVVNTFKVIANNYEETKLFRGESIFNNMKIPVITNDSEVCEFIIKHELCRPDKMINFFVDIGFSAVDTIIDSVNILHVEELSNSVAKVKAASKFYDKAMEEPKDKIENLKKAQDRLIDAIAELEGKVQLYIGKTIEIDNSTGFFLKHMFSISKVDTYNACAKYGLKAIEQAVKLHIMIANELDENIDITVIKSFENYIQKLLKMDACTTMHLYDKNKSEEFWLHVKNMPKQMNTIDQIIDDYKNTEIDYDNMIF